MKITTNDVELMEEWWVQKSRVNFFAYRRYMRDTDFEYNWFVIDLCKKLQQFYLDLKKGLRPILIINTPPQHGKSWVVSDFIAWISGRIPDLRTIYATFSDMLGKRCNLAQQRFMNTRKYNRIFPEILIPERKDKAVKTTELIEFIKKDGTVTNGQFRNTTIGGRVNGESLDLGIIDDAVKGRKEANSPTVSQGIWEWFTDDFNTRFSKLSGLLLVMTRWTTHDIVSRVKTLKEKLKGRKFSSYNYKAIATDDEEHRKCGEALFPELKPLEFLLDQKATMPEENWEAVYQGCPTIAGGNKFKDDWWCWYQKKNTPKFKYKFITADTAQKDKDQNDWTVFQCWGYGYDDRIYMIDKLRAKFDAPTLRKEAKMFYDKHNTTKIQVDDPVLRGMYIEDKSSGTGLIQELRKLRAKIIEVPRVSDKNMRADDASPEVQAGRVVLSTDIPGTDNLTKEAREYPRSEFDDDIDTLMTAIEVAFLNKTVSNSLLAAMEAA